MLKILNASPGFGAPLTELETVDFLKTGKLNIHLGTVDEKGHPNVHPAWYYYDPVMDDRILRAQKIETTILISYL